MVTGLKGDADVLRRVAGTARRLQGNEFRLVVKL